MDPETLEWVALKCFSASTYNKRTAALMIEQLKEKNVPCYKHVGYTTKGTRAVRIYVKKGWIERARYLISKFSPIKPVEDL